MQKSNITITLKFLNDTSIEDKINTEVGVQVAIVQLLQKLVNEKKIDNFIITNEKENDK